MLIKGFLKDTIVLSPNLRFIVGTVSKMCFIAAWDSPLNKEVNFLHFVALMVTELYSSGREACVIMPKDNL